jgi:cysteine sulfinate desulfinase/cysteine desulfurase-like protein
MRIYLDHNAGTPMRPEVRKALAAFAQSDPGGNPAAVHRAGQSARRELEYARGRVASAIGAPARSIVFTSGGTESNNLAIKGAVEALRGRRRIVSSSIEHSSILSPLEEIERHGFEAVRAGVDTDGRLTQGELRDAINDVTALVTLGIANAEVGTVQDLTEIADKAHRHGALFHVDAAQALGRIELEVDEIGCDLLTISAHKIGGLAGTGALYVRPGCAIAPQIHGGPHEAGLRAGTPNLVGAISFGIAAEAMAATMGDEAASEGRLSNALLVCLRKAIPRLRLNGPEHGRLPNTLNLTFPGVLGESMLIALDLEGIEVSMGSACAAGAVEPSHVLLAMGRSAAEARSSIRISLGWSTTPDEIARAAEIIPQVWRRVLNAEPIMAPGAAS